MNSFWKGILETVTHAGIQALSAATIAAASYAAPGLAQALGTGLNYLYQGGKAVLSLLGQGIQATGRFLGHAFNGVKSFFSNVASKIHGTRAPPINTHELIRGPRGQTGLGFPGGRTPAIEFGPGAFPGEKIGWTYDGTGDPNALIRGNTPGSFDLSKLDSSTFRADTGEGNFSQLRFNSLFDKTPTIEQIGNLPNQTPVPSRPFDLKGLAYDLLTKGPMGVGERIGKLPITKEAATRTGEFLRSPGGHQLLSQTSEFSGAAANASAIAALDPVLFPGAASAYLVFKGISVVAKAIDIGFNSDNRVGDTAEEIIKIYGGTQIRNPIVSPFINKGLDEYYEYLKSRERYR